ncbi:MAG: PIN domain-containing protein [Verrucomicrobiae bacterium]|nr:PIN domain-containing protein [Verrucomicrobiae bacterium]
MRFCADSSFLVRLYDPLTKPAELRSIRDYVTNDQKTVSLCDLCRVEVLNVLLSRSVRAAARFEADLATSHLLRLELVDWVAVFKHAESHVRRFSRSLRPGGHDLVLVAAAVAMGATWFLSFDTNSRQRQLAAAVGLHVWPPLEKDEKGMVKHAVSSL